MWETSLSLSSGNIYVPGVHPPGGDPDLRAQPHPVAVGHAGGAVGEGAGRVGPVQEGLGRVRVLGDDGVGVAGAVAVDVVDGLVHVADGLDGAGKVAVLGPAGKQIIIYSN